MVEHAKLMQKNPYTPPQSEVVDTAPKEYMKWGRATWLHLPSFFLSLLALIEARQSIFPGPASWGIWAGLLLTAGLAYLPVRSLNALSDKAPPWWSDVIYYSTVTTFLAGIATHDANLAFVGAIPTVLLNGIGGFMALAVERRHKVRVYISGRRYVFTAVDTR